SRTASKCASRACHSGVSLMVIQSANLRRNPEGTRASRPHTSENVAMTNVLGIDIGGTGIKGAPVDTTTGELVADQHRIPTPHPAAPRTRAIARTPESSTSSTEGRTGAALPPPP